MKGVPMSDLDVLNRMDGFESRLVHLEQLLGVRWPAAAQKPPAPRPARILAPHLTAPSPVEELPELVEPDVSTPFTPPPVPVMTYRAQPKMTPIHPAGLEQTIGLKWAGWIGAVVLVIGAGLGIKFAYDQGWFQIVSPVVRLGLLAMAGAGLIGLGELVFRKVNVLSAVGLFGAGVALLFLASYSGHAYYDLYPRNAAFVFMGLCTIIGALVARRGNMVSIAVLSMIGGNLAPVLLSAGEPLLGGFLIYLLTLQVTSLTLAFWGAESKWWALRGLSLASTCLWMTAVIDQPNQSLLLAFLLVFAGLFQLELVMSGAKSRLHPPRAGTTFSLLVTTAMTAGVLYLLRDSTSTVRLINILAFAGIAGTGSVIFTRLARESRPLRELSFGYGIQALALIVIAIPVAFSGIWISAAWGGLAIGLALLGWLLDLPTARYGSLIVWTLALVDLGLWTSGTDGVRRDQLIGLTLGGFEFPQFVLVSWMLALQGQLLAKLAVSDRHHPASENALWFGAAISLIAGGIWVMTALDGLSPLIATASILMYALLLVTLDVFERDLHFFLQGAVLVLAATLKWAAVDLLGHRMFDAVSRQSLFFSTPGFTSFLVLVSLLLIYFRAAATVQIKAQSKELKAITFAAMVGVLFLLGTFGIDQTFINLRLSGSGAVTDPERAEQVAFSIFWSLFALTCIACGFGWPRAGLRYVGLGLFAITLLKLVAIDLDEISTGYRILSFMGLGLLLLGTSVLYGKVSPMILAKNGAAVKDG
jgi:uncharacterized membrane protein